MSLWSGGTGSRSFLFEYRRILARPADLELVVEASRVGEINPEPDLDLVLLHARE